MTYTISFTDLLRSGTTSFGNQPMEGYWMSLTPESGDDGNPYFYGDGHDRKLYIFDLTAIDYIINYIKRNGPTVLFLDMILSDNTEIFSYHEGKDSVAVSSIVHIIELPGAYIKLDQSYYDGDNADENKSNKVLRTLATGQSDITRHESLIKKELIPNYTGGSGETEDEWPEVLPEHFTIKIKIGEKIYSVEMELLSGEGEDPVCYEGLYTLGDGEPYPTASDGDEVGLISVPVIGTPEYIRLEGRQLESPWEMGDYYVAGDVIQSGDHKYTREYHDDYISVSTLVVNFEENINVNSMYHGYVVNFTSGK